MAVLHARLRVGGRELDDRRGRGVRRMHDCPGSVDVDVYDAGAGLNVDRSDTSDVTAVDKRRANHDALPGLDARRGLHGARRGAD